MKANLYILMHQCQSGSHRQAELIAGVSYLVRYIPGHLSKSMLVAILMVFLPIAVSARYVYTWESRLGPLMEATFMVSESAIADGIITAEEVLAPPDFYALAPEGVFTNLVAGSALAVDPITGAVLTSTNSLTVTNAEHTLLISATGYLVPTSPLQTQGHGHWNMTLKPEASYALKILDISNAHPQLQFTASVNAPDNVNFILQATSDFSSWMPIATNQAVGGVATVIDPESASYPARFYRVLITP